MDLQELQRQIEASSDETLQARLREIRTNRKRPPKDPAKAAVYEQKEDKKKQDLAAVVAQMSPEERAAMIASLTQPKQ